MICPECGVKLKESAEVCFHCHRAIGSNDHCEQRVTAVSTSDRSFKRTIFEQKSGEAPHRIVARVYGETNRLVSEKISCFMDAMDSRYGNLDTFIRNADDAAEEIFDALDEQFCVFLREQNIFQYDEGDISEETRHDTGGWQIVFDAIVEENEKIEGKEASERAYRRARKDNRGRVVGGGFGLSGAIDGMATAGAINMTTGFFHGIANAMGNAASAAEASRSKRKLFCDPEVRQTIRDSLWADCNIMLKGFVAFWNRLGISTMPWYSPDNLRQAENIENAVISGQVSSERMEQMLIQMLRLYPLDLSLYDTAARYLPEREVDFFDAAAEYGIDMYARKRHFEETACRRAKGLAESDVFAQYHESIGYNLADTASFLALLYHSKFSRNFAVLSDENYDTYDSQLGSIRRNFAEYGSNELPLCFMLEPNCGNSRGIFLTTDYLYLRSSYPKTRQIKMDYGCVEQIEMVQHDGRSYIQINNDAEVEVPEEVESWIAVDTIKFYASYCGFMSYAQVNQQESLTDAVLRYTGITKDQLEIGIEFSSEEDEAYAALPTSSSVVYCYNCGVANEQGAKYCMKCGTEL